MADPYEPYPEEDPVVAGLKAQRPFYEDAFAPAGRPMSPEPGVTWRDPDAAPTAEDDLARAEAEYRAAQDPGDPVVAGLEAQGYTRPRGLTRGDMFDALTATERAPSARNPQYPIAQEYASQALPLLEQGAQAHADLVSAQNQGAQVYADHYEAEAGRLQAQADEMDHQVQVQEARRQEMIDMERATIRKIESIQQQLNAAPDIDPGRLWNSMSAGRKFLWAIGAMMAGFGGFDAVGAMNGAIERDIDAQKANFEQRKAGFASAADLLGTQRNLYADIRQDIDDELVATDALRLLRLQQAEAALIKGLAANGVPLAQAQGNVHLNEIQQAKVQKIADIRSRIAAIPSRIGGGTRPALRGPVRDVVMSEFKRTGDVEGDIQLEGFKQEGAERQTRATAATKADEQIAKDAAELGKRTSKWTNTLAAIDEALAIAQRAGGKAPTRWTEERAAFDEAVGRGEMHAGTAETGASVSPDQTEKIQGMLGANRIGAWNKVDSLKRARDAVAAIIATEEAAFPESVRQFRHRNANLPGIQPSYVSEGMPASARRRE